MTRSIPSSFRTAMIAACPFPRLRDSGMVVLVYLSHFFSVSVQDIMNIPSYQTGSSSPAGVQVHSTAVKLL
jgi:hypothetical protein